MKPVPRLDYTDGRTNSFAPNASCWLDTKAFRIDMADAAPGDILAALIEHRQYRDHYAGLSADAQNQDLHGPYWRSAIRPETFQAVDFATAEAELVDWAKAFEVSAPLVLSELGALLLDRRSLLYRLPDLRSTAEHAWGWSVGAIGGFHEFVVIDRGRKLVTVMVASDD